MSEYFPIYVDNAHATTYRNAPEFDAWLDAMRGWRASQCVGPAPVAPDLTKCLQVWLGDKLVNHTTPSMWKYDIRGADLSTQDPKVAHLLVSSATTTGRWSRIGCTLPGESVPLHDATEAQVAMALSLMRQLGINRGKCNDHITDAIGDLLRDASTRIMQYLQTATINGSGEQQ